MSHTDVAVALSEFAESTGLTTGEFISGAVIAVVGLLYVMAEEDSNDEFDATVRFCNYVDGLAQDVYAKAGVLLDHSKPQGQ